MFKTKLKIMASACTQKDKGTGRTNVVGGNFQRAGSRIPHAEVQCNITYDLLCIKPGAKWPSSPFCLSFSVDLFI